MHLPERLLQAHLDGELSPEEDTALSDHLHNCVTCRKRFDEVSARARANRSRLDVLIPSEPAPDSMELLRRVELEAKAPPKTPWRSAWAAAVVVAALVVGLYFEPVRVAGAEFLNLFRVKQIAVVRIDPANLERLERDFFGADTERNIEQLLSTDAHVVKRGEPREVSSANDAGRLAGFGVRLPALQTQSKIQVHPAVDISFSIDAERLQGFLDDAGRPDIRIPEGLDGEMIRVNIPASVTTFFGKCPELQKPESDASERHHRQNYPECKVVVQLPAPSVVAPPSLEIKRIGAEILKLFGLTEEQAQKFSESIDWSSTLVVPLPLDPHMKFSEVQVDSVEGHLFATDKHGIEAYNLMWIRDGIVYAVMGQGNPDDALAIANSM